MSLFSRILIYRWHVAETCNLLTADHAQLHRQRRADAPRGCEDELSSRQCHTTNRCLRARPTGLSRARWTAPTIMDGPDVVGILRCKELKAHNDKFRQAQHKTASASGESQSAFFPGQLSESLLHNLEYCTVLSRRYTRIYKRTPRPLT